MAISGTIAAAGIGAAGSIISSKNAAKAAENGQTATQAPWAEQQPYLTDAWKQAQLNFQASQNSPFYQGPLYTGLNDTQKAGLNGITNWAGTNGGLLAGNTTNASTDALTRGNYFGNNVHRPATLGQFQG